MFVKIGQFSVGAAYNLLQGFELNNSDGWMSIWQLEVPERIRLLKHDQLFTNSRRHIMRLGSLFCIHCSDLYETVLHVMSFMLIPRGWLVL